MNAFLKSMVSLVVLATSVSAHANMATDLLEYETAQKAAREARRKNAAGFQNSASTSATTLRPQTGEAVTLPSQFQDSHRFPLTVLVDSRSRWSFEQVEKMIRDTEKIYHDDCRVSISPITVKFIEHPALSNLDCNRDDEFTGDLNSNLERPIVTFIDSVRCDRSARGGLADAVQNTGYANPDYEILAYGPQASLNTVFIQSRIFSMQAQYPNVVKGLLGHELLHLFVDAGHNHIPGNLLDGGATRGLKIDDQERTFFPQLTQCDKVRKSPLTRGPQ